MPTKKSRSKPAAKATGARKAAPAAARPAVERLAAPAAGRETLETVLKAGTQAASKGYEQALAIAQEQVDQASQRLFSRYDEAASFGTDNVDAYVLSGTALARGVESMSKALIGIAQNAVEANIAASKALFGATSVREVIDLQTEFSRSRFESLVADSARLAGLGLTLTGEAVEPIQARLNATVEQLAKPLAV